MFIIRDNSLGWRYHITALDKDTTEIRRGTKKIVVHTDFDTINQAWYNWQMTGKYIQDAFPFFTASEREFLLTGLTDEEWDALFPYDENVEDIEKLVNEIQSKKDE